MTEFKAPTVALYQPGLLWFNQADKGTTPCPAIPIEITGNGVLTLLVMRKHNATVLTKQGVRHVDDPFLGTCMDARLMNGGWMHAETPVDGLQEQINALKEQNEATREQIEELLTNPKKKKELAAV
jgi:hypothetical protein